MVTLGNTHFQIYDYYEDWTKQEPISFADYNSSANFILGIVDEKFDFFANPYIRINAYQMSEDFRLKESTKMELRKCTREDLTAFMPERTASYYPNSLCFKDRQKVRIKGNWFDQKFTSVHLTIEECVGAGCKSRDEIADFMSRTLFYYVSQSNTVAPEIYSEESRTLGY